LRIVQPEGEKKRNVFFETRKSRKGREARDLDEDGDAQRL